MNPKTQGLIVGLMGSVCLRLASSNEYLRFVNPWMRWPLLATAALLLTLGVRLLWSREDEDDHVSEGEVHADHRRSPNSAWMLVLPIIAVFVVSPPALGAYAADRTAVKVAGNGHYGSLSSGSVSSMSVAEFQGRAQWDDTLEGATVQLTGFVSTSGGHWYVTRLVISCCAADAVAYRIRIDGAVPTPPVNSWVQVTGSWEKPATTAIPRLDPPVLRTTSVSPVAEPKDPYE
ncbi:MAG: TIGR03943 family putative permease subunit [Marmoricola sp.]